MARPPPSKEVQEFQFKLHCRLKIFPSENCYKSERPLKLLASSSKYGLIFVGSPSGVQCINVAAVLNLQESRAKNRGNISDYPRRELVLPSSPTHLDISCDSELLAVVLMAQNCPMFHIYSVASFGSKDIVKKHEIMLSNTPGVDVMDIQWNPGLQNVIGSVLSDGSVIACEFKDNSFSLNTLPASTQATCLCWSPKGKQVVIGDAKGTLSQYKPELKLVKSFPAPQLTSNPQTSYTLISVQWLSSYQFAAVYKDAIDSSKRSALVIVNAPKAGDINCINYEEICFGSGTKRPQHFFIHQQTWNMLIIGCGNSMELGVLKQIDETSNWEQWRQDEATRAELPLTDDHQDVCTVGMSFDTSNQKKIPIGDSATIDPMPIVHMLSHDGVLCMFYSINLLPNAANLCAAPQPLPDQSGLSLFNVPQTPAQGAAPLVTSTPIKTTVEQPLSFGSTPATSAPVTNLFSTAFASPTPNAQGSLFGNNSSFSFPNFGQSVTQPTMQQPQTPKLGQSVPLQPSTVAQTSVAQPVLSTGSLLGGQGKLFPSPQLGQALSVGQQPAPTYMWNNPPPPAVTSSTLHAPVASSTPKPTTAAFLAPKQFEQPAPTTPQAPLVQQQEKQPEPSTIQESLVQQKPVTSSIPTQVPQAIVEPKPLQQKPAIQQPSVIQLMPQQQQVITQPSQQTSSVLQQTTVPQLIQGSTSFSLSGGQSKGGFTTHPNFSIQPSHRKQDAVKATTITPITVSSFQGKTTAKVSKEKTDGLKTSNNLVNKTTKSSESLEKKYKAAIKSEVNKFAVELNTLKAIISNINVNIGDEEEKKILKMQTENLESFGTDLRETTSTQEAEVSALRGNLMETFSWFENIHGKHSQLIDSKYSPPKESVDLDPISRQHIKSIEKNLLYLESHVKVISADLENQWVQKKKDLSKKSSFELPAFEAIFQSIMTIYKLIAQQKMVITELENRVPMKARKKMNFQESKIPKEKKHITGDTELSKLAEKLLSTKLGEREDLGMSYSDEGSKYKSLMKSQQCLQSKQENALRQWHKNFKGIRTQVIKKRMVSEEMINATVIEPEELLKVAEMDDAASNLNKGVNKENLSVSQQKSEISSVLSLSPASMSGKTVTQTVTPSSAQITPQSNKSVFTTTNFSTPSQTANNGFTGYTTVKAVDEISEISPHSSDGNALGVTKSPLNRAENSSVPKDAVISHNIFSGMGQSNFNAKPTPNKQESAMTYEPANSSATSLPPKTDPILKVPQFSFPNAKDSTKPAADVAGKKDDVINAVPGMKPLAGDGDQTNKSIFGQPAFRTVPLFAPAVNPVVGFSVPSQNTTFVTPEKSFGTMESSLKMNPSPKPDSSTGVATGISNKEPSDLGGNSFGFGSLSAALQSPIPTSQTPSNSLLKTPQLNTSLTQGQSTGNAITASTGVKPITSEATLPLSFGQLSTNAPEQKGGSNSLFGSVPAPSVFSGTATAKPFSFSDKTSIFGSGTSLFATSKPFVEPSNESDAQKSGSKEVSSSETVKPTPSSEVTPTPSVTTSAAQSTTESTNEATSAVDTSVTTTSSTASSIPTETNQTLPPPPPAATTSELSFGSVSISATSAPVGQTSTTPFFQSQSSFLSSTSSSGLLPTPSVFATTAASSNQKVFGNSPAPATTSTASVFGGSLTATTSSNSLFGTPTGSMFATAAQSTSAPTYFGSATPTTTPAPMFNTVVPPSTTTTSLFGTPTTSAAAQPSVFGGVGTTTASQPVFGTSTSSSINFGTPTSSSTFGNTTTVSTLFGGSTTLSFATPTTSSAFSPAVTTTSSIFGTPASGFGTPTTTVSLFGTPTTSSFGAQSPSVFGGTTASTAFGTPATSGSSFFAQPAATPATSSSSVFGQSPNVFGQPATTSTPFGTLFGQKPVFGQPGSSVFNQSSSAGNFGSSGGSLFGSSGFGAQNQQQSNVFQSPGGNTIFGGGSNAAAGSFTGGNQSVSQTGFGSPPSFQNKPPAFGGTGTPVFGGQSSFGASPTFGGASTFGSPNKVFGSPNQTAFSNIPQQSPQPSTFETLATQNTMTFGNLAQTQPTTGFGSSTFGTPPQTTQPSFGGSSFSTWR